jgi:hypothetical protein
VTAFFYFIDGRAKRDEEACGVGCDGFVCQRGAGHAMPHIAYREDGGAIGMWADPVEASAALTEGAEAVALLTEWGHARAAVARASNAAHDVAGRHGTAEALAIAEGIEVVCEEQVHALADRLTTTRPSAEGSK